MTTDPKMKQISRLNQVADLGQSIWLDYIRRSFTANGDLKKLIDDGLRGVTSNPAIFEKAIGGSTDYVEFLANPANRELSAGDVYEQIAVSDIQAAADAFKEVYARTKARDGYVSLEVSPTLARNTQGTIAEGKRLWAAVKRPNVMIKVPGTPEGIPAIEELIASGINVNVTLLFAVDAYEEAARAYIRGLKRYSESHDDLSHIASVASFFLSRIDSAIDAMLDAKAKTLEGAEKDRVLGLRGKAAIANAKVAYEQFAKLFSGPEWEALAKKGAQRQRLLWASTGTKNPAYPDTLYVDSLIGKDTVNTAPPATVTAWVDHGTAAETLDKDVPASHKLLDDLNGVGISMKEVTDKLLVEGLKLFEEAFEKLIGAVEAHKPQMDKVKITLPSELQQPYQSALEDWKKNDKARKLWNHDASLWKNADEAKWMGWLDITDDQLAHLQKLQELQKEVKARGYKYVVLLGMGGSSLCPEVTAKTFGKQDGFPELLILDTTNPAQIAELESKIDYKSTLFIVSSKSGSTLEPNIFKQYFFEQCKKAVGDKAKDQFIAVTDPGSKMQGVAEADGFAHIFPGCPSIGGRYSALSNFGMVPAAAAGIDVNRLLDEAESMVHACGPSVPADENPGVVLGAALGVCGNAGRDKVTIIASPAIYDFGAWLEQLLAESTGKIGKGLIPVDREALGDPQVYGKDRVFAYLRLKPNPDAAQDAAIDKLAAAGHPVVRIDLGDIYDIGQEYFRWEFATAVAGSVLGINPFDQPDVEASKIATKALTSEYEQKGSLPAEKPFFEDGGIQLFADDKNAAELKKSARDQSLKGYLQAFLNELHADDYFAVLAYVDMNEKNEEELQELRHAVRDAKKVATCLGFGPRFLHSTGQAYKGGPNSGVFLQMTCDHAKDLQVPGQKYTFGVVQSAQARGDLQVLSERGRRALRIHLPADVSSAIARVSSTVQDILKS